MSTFSVNGQSGHLDVHFIVQNKLDNLCNTALIPVGNQFLCYAEFMLVFINRAVAVEAVVRRFAFCLNVADR
jgi:hypothetical protein